MGYNICPAKKLKPNTSACKARLGCGLCGCAARPAPRASHRQAHARRHTNERSRRKPHHTQGRGKNNHTPHTRKRGGARCARANNHTDGGGGLRPPPPSVWLFFPLPCVWCGFLRERSFVWFVWRRMCA